MEHRQKKGKLLNFLDCKRRILLKEQDIQEHLTLKRRVWLRVAPEVKPFLGKAEKKDKP